MGNQLKMKSVIAFVALIFASAAHGACPTLIHFETDKGVYQPGGVVEISVILQCNGPGSCGPCTLNFHIGSGCGVQMGWVDVASFPAGISTSLNFFMIIPQDAPAGTYHICLRPQCSACAWSCHGCDQCQCADQWITINSPVIGDITGDGAINVPDLLAVIEAWGSCPAPPQQCPADIAPAGGDGAVNVTDLLAVINNWT